MINLKDIPSGTLFVTARKAADIAGADQDIAVFYADKAYKILGAGFIPDTVLTGADTESRDLIFVNKGTAGTGVTVIGHVHYIAGVNIAAFDYGQIVALTDLKTLAAGEVVSFQSTHVGATGLACPAGDVILLVWPIAE